MKYVACVAIILMVASCSHYNSNYWANVSQGVRTVK